MEEEKNPFVEAVVTYATTHKLEILTFFVPSTDLLPNLYEYFGVKDFKELFYDIDFDEYIQIINILVFNDPKLKIESSKNIKLKGKQILVSFLSGIYFNDDFPEEKLILKPKLFYHCTRIDNLKSIFQVGYLLTQSNRSRIQLIPFEGEGVAGRQSFPAKNTLTNGWIECISGSEVEAEGIYFRVVPPNCMKNSIALVFDAAILRKDGWNINTAENNGFYISQPGISAEAIWGGGSKGITFDSSNMKNYSLYVDSNPSRHHELIVHNSVSLKFLRGILATPDQKSKITSIGIHVKILTPETK